MKIAPAVWLLCSLVVVFGCGPTESMRRVSTLTETDCVQIKTIVEKLSVVLPPNTAAELDSFDGLLFGEKIPPQLAYLKPQAVRLKNHYAMIYLYKTPAGEDSIEVFFNDKESIWTIKTHVGSWKNESKVIWASKKKPTPENSASP